MGWESELKRQERGIDQGQGGFITSAGEGIRSILFFAGSLTFIGAMVFFLVGMIFSAGDLGGKWPGAESSNVQAKRTPFQKSHSDAEMAEAAITVHMSFNIDSYGKTRVKGCRHRVLSRDYRILACNLSGENGSGHYVNRNVNFFVKRNRGELANSRVSWYVTRAQ